LPAIRDVDAEFWRRETFIDFMIATVSQPWLCMYRNFFAMHHNNWIYIRGKWESVRTWQQGREQSFMCTASFSEHFVNSRCGIHYGMKRDRG
jgi:hypothetical protein